MKRFSISITGNDQPGIIAGISKICYQYGGNLEDASMTILSGEFAMILFVSFTRKINYKSLGSAIEEFENSKKLHVLMRPIDSLQKKTKKAGKKTSYLLSIFGRDRAGIVYRVSEILAKNRLNITDLNSKRFNSGGKTIYGLLIEVDIPKKFRMQPLNRKLNALAKSLNVDLNLKPVESLAL